MSRIRSFPFVIGLAALLSSCNCHISAPAQSAARTVTVSGTADRNILPNKAEIMVKIVANDDRLAPAKARTDAALAKVKQAVADAGAKPEDIRIGTQQFMENPEYRYEKKGKPFQARVDMTVELLDLSRYEALATTLVAIPDVQIGNTQFTIRDEIATRSEVRKEALKAAQAKAREMAESLGCKIGKPLQIQENGVSEWRGPAANFVGFAAAGGGGDGGPGTGSGGMVTVQVVVGVSFELLD